MTDSTHDQIDAQARRIIKQMAATGGGVYDPLEGAVCPFCLRDVDGDFGAGFFPLGHAVSCVWVQCRQLVFEIEQEERGG